MQRTSSSRCCRSVRGSGRGHRCGSPLPRPCRCCRARRPHSAARCGQGARRHDAPDSVGDRGAPGEARPDPGRPALEPHVRAVRRRAGGADRRRRAGRRHRRAPAAAAARAARDRALPRREEPRPARARARPASRAATRSASPAAGRAASACRRATTPSTSPPRRSTAVRRTSRSSRSRSRERACDAAPCDVARPRGYSRHVVSDGVHA